MNTAEEVLGALAELSERSWALQVVSAVVESGMIGALDAPRTAAEIGARHGVPPSLVEGLLDVLVAIGLVAREQDRFVATPGLVAVLRRGEAPLRADLRTTVLQGAHLVDAAKRGQLATGWRADDRELVAAQGVLSAAMLEPISRRLLPQLDGVKERLAAPGAAFLDVGAGAAGHTISMAREFPSVRVVGLEPAPVPLEEARRNVAASGISDRIELREQRVEEIDDVEQFDLAWLPQMFLPDAVLEQALPRLLRALRPGGWLMTASISAPGAELRPALSRLRNALWGGGVRFSDELQRRLRDAGFAPVLAVPMPGPAAMITQPIVAQRPA